MLNFKQILYYYISLIISIHLKMKPKHSITTKTQNSSIFMDYAKCIGCNACVRACDEQAISVFTASAERF